MTDSFVVHTSGPLHGSVRISGATKNAGTKQMAAALLAPGVTTLRNVDPVADLDVMIDVLRAIGATVEWTGPAELQIDASSSLHAEAPYELVTRVRESKAAIIALSHLLEHPSSDGPTLRVVPGDSEV